MNSKEMFEFFEKSTTREIQILISMAIRYLEEKREVEFKNIIKDIKGARKYLMGVSWYE